MQKSERGIVHNSYLTVPYPSLSRVCYLPGRGALTERRVLLLSSKSRPGTRLAIIMLEPPIIARTGPRALSPLTEANTTYSPPPRRHPPFLKGLHISRDTLAHSRTHREGETRRDLFLQVFAHYLSSARVRARAIEGRIKNRVHKVDTKV